MYLFSLFKLSLHLLASLGWFSRSVCRSFGGKILNYLAHWRKKADELQRDGNGRSSPYFSRCFFSTQWKNIGRIGSNWTISPRRVDIYRNVFESITYIVLLVTNVYSTRKVQQELMFDTHIPCVSAKSLLFHATLRVFLSHFFSETALKLHCFLIQMIHKVW